MSAPGSLQRLRQNGSKARNRPQMGQIWCESWFELGQIERNITKRKIGRCVTRLVVGFSEHPYAEHSSSNNKNSLYNSYIRGIRWASDRIGPSGIVGFVTSGGYLDANSADGLRKCLAQEFSSLYVLNLRGDASKSGEQRRREKDNIFGSGSRSPIAIALFVKNPNSNHHGKIFYHDIGDYLSREEKLTRITDFGSVAGISARNAWQAITPDAHGDWLKQRDTSFTQFLAIGDKSGESTRVVQLRC